MFEPVHISEILKKVRKDFEKKHLNEYAAKLIDWQAVAGEEFSSHSKCDYIKGSTLYISVESSSYMFGMKLQKKSMLNAVKKMYPDIKIEQIKFQLWRKENDKF